MTDGKSLLALLVGVSLRELSDVRIGHFCLKFASNWQILPTNGKQEPVAEESSNSADQLEVKNNCPNTL